jgi:UDP-2,3-diacylglucosamine hydrolase
MVHDDSMNAKIGLIAGSGQFPLLFARIAAQRGWQVYAAGYHDETDPRLAAHVSSLDWFYLGQVKRLIKYFHQNGVERAVMMGAITKTRMFTNVRPDIKAISLITKMRHTHDDALLRAFADLLEGEGIRIESSTMLLPELLAPPGIWTRRKPSKSERADIQLGWRIAKAVGRLDIGQCVVVGGGSVLAVEAIDGTDATILRGGKLGKGEAVVVKVCKPMQDTRFDIPAVGRVTIETMEAADSKVLAVEAGRAVVFDRHAMIESANACGISIIALTDSDFSANDG